jgi:hypothetical protein
MIRYALIGVSLIATGALAQQADTKPPAGPVQADPAKIIVMDQPMVGDHWTYEVFDEITGKKTQTRTLVVTDVTPNEISVRFSYQGSDRTAFSIYDRSWSLKSSDPWTYSPNDGLGIKPPLQVGATWTFKSDEVNSTAGAAGIWKRTGSSKVVGQERLTTKAGTFETFKIETTYSKRRPNDPNNLTEITIQTWYAPAIGRWVKQTVVTRTNKLLRENATIELVEYGRKGPS